MTKDYEGTYSFDWLSSLVKFGVLILADALALLVEIRSNLCSETETVEVVLATGADWALKLETLLSSEKILWASRTFLFVSLSPPALLPPNTDPPPKSEGLVGGLETWS